jgi:hypothetical protein
MGEAAHGLQVLCEYHQPRIDHNLHVAQHALEIRRQRLHCGARRTFADGAHTGGDMRRAAIRQIVAIDAGEHDVGQLHQCHAGSHVDRFVSIEPAARIAGIH